MVVLWHVIATTFFKPQFFPGPLAVLATGTEMVASGELFEHISISLQRILAGFLIGSAIAAPAGLVMGSVPIVRAIFDPCAQFFRFVPSLAWLTPVVIWFGIGETSKVLIVVCTTWAAIVELLTQGKTSAARNELLAVSGIAASTIADQAPKHHPIVTTCDGPRTRIYCIYDDDAADGSDVNEDPLGFDPLKGDWRVSLPCTKDDLAWVQGALKKHSTRITARGPDDEVAKAEAFVAAHAGALTFGPKRSLGS